MPESPMGLMPRCSYLEISRQNKGATEYDYIDHSDIISEGLNRNSTTRAIKTDQICFRGNGRNYDLNRDFIKSDTKIPKVCGTLSQTQPRCFYRQPCKQWCGLSIQTNVYHDTTKPTRTVLGTLILKWCLRLFWFTEKKYWNYALRKCF
jgi:hypothetical protein